MFIASHCNRNQIVEGRNFLEISNSNTEARPSAKTRFVLVFHQSELSVEASRRRIEILAMDHFVIQINFVILMISRSQLLLSWLNQTFSFVLFSLIHQCWSVFRRRSKLTFKFIPSNFLFMNSVSTISCNGLPSFVSECSFWDR